MLIRRVTATLGLFAFAVTVLGGMVSDNSLEFILTRALWALAGFCGLGAMIGWAADHVVREHQARQYQEIFGHAQGLEEDEAIEEVPVAE